MSVCFLTFFQILTPRLPKINFFEMTYSTKSGLLLNIILRVLDKRILDSSVGNALSAELGVKILPDKLELSQLKAILTLFYAESNPTYFTRGGAYMPPL